MSQEQGAVVSVLKDACAKDVFSGTGTPVHVGVVADANARLVLWTVEGTVCDGGVTDEAGFTWFQGDFRDINTASKQLRVLPAGGGDSISIRGSVYDRALLVSELVGNYRAAAGARVEA